MMKRINLGNRITPILLTACALLGAVVAVEWHTLSRHEAAVPAKDVQSAPVADLELTRSTYVAPDFEAFSEILERPLFTEGRMPPAEQPAAETTAATPRKVTPLKLRLEGIALTPEARVAVIRDLASKKLYRLAEGEKHQGWTLEVIHPAGATLRLGEQTEELTLELEEKSAGKAMIPGMLKGRTK